MESGSSQRPRGASLVVHFLIPTWSSSIAYIFFGLLFIAGHLLGLMLTNAAVPSNPGQQLIGQYSHHIIDPVTSLLNNEFVSSMLTLVLWGGIGWVVCASMAALTTRFNEWYQVERDIAVPSYGVVVRHPLRRTLFMRFIWQLFVAILIALFTATAVQMAQLCFDNDIRILQAPTFIQGLSIASLTVLTWMAIFHGYVILFRLYLLRTRVFGEILY